nr:hypothetical protein BaRGS_008599 [Batillaria attramentaria]
MKLLHFLALALTVAVCSLAHDAGTEERQRRSDDPSPLQAVVENLSREVSSNKAEISALKAQMAANDATTLQAAVDSLTQQVTSNNARISALQADFNAKISALESSRNAKIAALESDLAFHAEFSEDDVTLGRSSPLVLDNAVTNVGSGYDAHTGNFKAPVSGSYMFVFRSQNTVVLLLFGSY